MSLSLKQFTLYLALLSIGSSTGWLGNQYLQQYRGNHSGQTIPVVGQGSVYPTPPMSNQRLVPRSNPNFIAEAAELVGPAVVRIDATRRVATKVPEAFNNPLFRRFFGENLPTPEERVRRGTGSGLILSSEGQIITNAHVVNGANFVQVTLKDGRQFEGKVLGVDDLTDVAVVKINAKELPTAPLGRSDSLVPGQWAIAIGNPLGLDNTVTVGIISATGRSSSQVGIPDKRVRFIQTDAAINPGNSGGPLLNDQGEIIGINTAIRADAQGLGFAIPIETALRIANQLFTKGKADHPFLGISMVEMNATVKKDASQRLQLKITAEKGVLIMEVLENSPAAQAGLKPGDVIVKVAGAAVETPTQVQELVEQSIVGEELALSVNRGGKLETIKVWPGTFPETDKSGNS